MYKIAIVDDSADTRDLLYYLLRDQYEIARYQSGDEAIRELKHAPPDLIIMDIRLHDMDGVAVLNEIRQQEDLRNVPALALTANAMSGDREKYLAAGFDEYISKPVLDMDIFIETIRRLLSGPSD